MSRRREFLAEVRRNLVPLTVSGLELARLRRGVQPSMRGVVSRDAHLPAGALLVARPVPGPDEHQGVVLFVHAAARAEPAAPRSALPRRLGYLTVQDCADGRTLLAARVMRVLDIPAFTTLVLEPVPSLPKVFLLRATRPSASR